MGKKDIKQKRKESQSKTYSERSPAHRASRTLPGGAQETRPTGRPAARVTTGRWGGRFWPPSHLISLPQLGKYIEGRIMRVEVKGVASRRHIRDGHKKPDKAAWETLALDPPCPSKWSLLPAIMETIMIPLPRTTEAKPRWGLNTCQGCVIRFTRVISLDPGNNPKDFGTNVNFQSQTRGNLNQEYRHEMTGWRLPR